MQKNFNSEYNTGTVSFQGKLLSLGTTVLENKNGKPYVVGSVQFTNQHGELKTVSAICYEANVEKMVEGETYTCNAIFTEGIANPLIVVSPIMQAERATADDFGTSFEELMEEAGVGAEQTA